MTSQFFVGLAVAGALALLLVNQFLRGRAKTADQGRMLFQSVVGLFDHPVVEGGKTAGVWMLSGMYRNHNFQISTIADTLATRKLPSLWLMVTLPEPQPLKATTNMMMRAAGVSSFSNFDFLPHTLTLPEGFPEQATLRSDENANSDVVALMVPHLALFRHKRGKEFLIAPKGLRIVVQLAEGDRARYGVLREASFEGTSVDAQMATEIMDTLIALQKDIHRHAKS